MGKQLRSLEQHTEFSNSNHKDSEQVYDFKGKSAKRLLSLADKYFDLAMSGYQAIGASSAVINNLQNCGLAYLHFYASEELPDSRDVLVVYYRALPCVVCFCDEASLSDFLELEEWRYCWPPIDANPSEWHIVSELNIQSNVRRYVREVLKFLSTGRVDEAACAELNSHLQSGPGIDKMSIAKELSLGLLALQAIHHQQTEELRHHLLNLIKSHQQRASRGQLRGDNNGIVAMQALMLATIAKQRGMSLGLDEDYPPIQLIHPSI